MAGELCMCVYIYVKCLELSEQFIFNCRIQLKESLKGKKKKFVTRWISGSVYYRKKMRNI